MSVTAQTADNAFTKEQAAYGSSLARADLEYQFLAANPTFRGTDRHLALRSALTSLAVSYDSNAHTADLESLYWANVTL